MIEPQSIDNTFLQRVDESYETDGLGFTNVPIPPTLTAKLLDVMTPHELITNDDLESADAIITCQAKPQTIGAATNVSNASPCQGFQQLACTSYILF